MKEYDAYLKAKAARVRAEEWHNLPHSEHKYLSHSCRMSAGQGTLILRRCGQHSAGAQYYWDSPGELNAAILAVIADDPTVIEQGIARLREAERAALVSCKAAAENLMADVAKAESGGE